MNQIWLSIRREPAVIVGLLEAVIAGLLAFRLGISPESYAPWLALVVALGGVLTAIATKQTMLGALIGLLKAGGVLAAVYGLNITNAQTASLIGVVTVGFGLYQRTQTSPSIKAAVDPAYIISGASLATEQPSGGAVPGVV